MDGPDLTASSGSNSQIRRTRQSSRLAGPAKSRPSYVESGTESDDDERQQQQQQPVRKKRKMMRRGRPRLSDQPVESVDDAPSTELATTTTTTTSVARPVLSERDLYMLMLLDTSNSRNSYCPYAHVRRPTTSSSLSLLLNHDFDDAEARLPRDFVGVYMAHAEHARSNRTSPASTSRSPLSHHHNQPPCRFPFAASSNRPWSHFPTHASPHYPSSSSTSFAHVPPVASRLRPATWPQHHRHSSFRTPDPRHHHHHHTHHTQLLSPPQLRHTHTHTHTRNRSLSDSSGSSTAESAFPATPSPRVFEPALTLQHSPSPSAATTTRKSTSSWMDTVLSSATPAAQVSPGPLFKSTLVPPRAPAPTGAAACWQCTTLGPGACSRHTTTHSSLPVFSTTV
ncbi:hypothetical protein BKA62DRAFT_711343 [Auriculariales sp. MPI-PUGE-AT-0066]|nr:hypothetical protein BKA62DRAFT_711343 [Auriculariales sp. MPI-PUGE-AT-0066]